MEQSSSSILRHLDEADGATLVQSNDSQIIRNSLRVYGSLYFAIFFTFCIVRRRFPKLYNLRSWVPNKQKCELASTMSEKYGFVSWAWRVFRVDDDTLLENCGMDAVCFLRCLRLGAKLALVGIFNAIYLIPIFYTASDSQSDKFIRMSVANLPAGSERFAAVVVATYVAVFAALYLVAKEYNWYARLRHKFLGQDMPRNYAVYVYGIPEEMQSNYALADFFRLSSFSDPNQKPVLEANIAMDIPKLEAKVAKRKTVIQKLEHAIAEESIKGVVKTHRTFNLQNATDKEKRVTESVESVQAYRKELEELNKQISLEVGRIRNQNDPLRRHLSKQKGGSDLLRGRALTLDYDDCPAAEENEEVTIEFLESKDLPMLDDSQGGADMEYAYPFSDVSETEHTATAGDDDLEMGTIEESKPVDWPAEVETLENVDTRDETTSEVMELKRQDIDDARFANPRSTRSLASSASNSASRLKNRASSSMQRVSGSLHHLKPPPVNVETLTGGVKRARDLSVYGSKKVRDLGISGAQMAADKAKNAAAKAPRLASSLAENAAAIAPILRLKGEGAPREAGFVVFDGLFLTQAALQMLQHPVVTKMMVEDAPAPSDIYWRNVGLPSNSRRTGSLLSLAATMTLCLFWSFPVAFISSLTAVNSLKKSLPRLGTVIENNPALEQVLALMAPLLLLALNEGVLPIILKWFAAWEGHISSPRLEASLFRKLSAFTIIQTFFVSTVSGSIMAELTNMLNNPESIVGFLANSLPAQSSYFIQIVFVFTFLVQGIELLRVVPLSFAFVRRFVGPKLTAKERSRTWNHIYSLEDPPPFYLAEVFAQIVLFYVVFFVYSSISPITCVFLFACFMILESGYRYHFIHNYKQECDSGGRLWKGFMDVLMSSIIIGQLTLIGVLLLNQAFYSVPALAPLLGITILYWITVHPKRLHVASRLPAIQAKALDKERAVARSESCNLDDLRDLYLQPALQKPILLPDEHNE